MLRTTMQRLLGRFPHRVAQTRALSASASTTAKRLSTASPTPAMSWTDAGVPWRAGWGTVDNPVPIASACDSRVVACAGGPSREPHDLQWIVVHKGELRHCPECAQVFALAPRP